MKVKVRYINYGVMQGEDGATYLCDADGLGHVMNQDTGELFVISKRDLNEYPVEVSNEF